MQGIDVVFHLAAIRITQCVEEPRLALEVLVDGSFNVAEAAVEHGVRKLVASSSASIYGLAETFPTDERHHPYGNDTFYGAAKLFNEGLLRSFAATSGLDYCDCDGCDQLTRIQRRSAHTAATCGHVLDQVAQGST